MILEPQIIWHEVDWKREKNTALQWRKRVEEQQALFVEKEWSSSPFYDEINCDWDSPPIYDFYFDDNYDVNYVINNESNSSDNVINDILINKLEVKCKENMEAAQQKKIVDLGNVDTFDYKFAIITMANLFRDDMNTTHVAKQV